LTAGCGSQLDLPEEPEAVGIPQGEVAYVRKYPAWPGLGRVVDVVLTRGVRLYGVVEDSARVRCWFPDTATPRLNPGRSIPALALVDGDTLGLPVRVCEGANNVLWVAYRSPHPRVVAWDIDALPPVPIDGGIVRDDSILAFGGIAADPDSDFVYVADSGRSRIIKYAPSASGGRRVAVLATQGNGDHFVQQPQGLYYFGRWLLVADTGKSWIQVLDADVPFTGPGQIMGPEEDPLQLRSPLDVWVDSNGFFYVADTGNGRVVKLTPEGALKEIVTDFDPDPVGAPSTVAASPEEAWVVDSDTGRLTIFQLNTVSEDLP
jgi:hypothetical protein